MLITVFEILAIISIVIACCYYIPYFYLAAWATEIACVIRITPDMLKTSLVESLIRSVTRIFAPIL